MHQIPLSASYVRLTKRTLTKHGLTQNSVSKQHVKAKTRQRLGLGKSTRKVLMDFL